MNEYSFMIIGFIIGLVSGMTTVLISGYTSYITHKFGHKVTSSHVTSYALSTLVYMLMLILLITLLVSLVIESLNIEYQQALIIVIPVIAIMCGIGYIRRYFWHQPIVKLQHHKLFATKHLHRPSSLLQPFLVATALLYAASPVILLQAGLLSLLSSLYETPAIFWGMFFAVGVITPLYVVATLLITKTKASQIVSWVQKTKGTMSLYAGLCLVLLSWIVLYAAIYQGSGSL